MKNWLSEINVYVFALLLSASASVSSQTVNLLGTINCGQWLEAREQKQVQAAIYEHYLLGMINGMALASRVELWLQRGRELSSAQMYFWMDNYCRANPLKDVTAGAVSYAEEVSDGRYLKKIR